MKNTTQWIKPWQALLLAGSIMIVGCDSDSDSSGSSSSSLSRVNIDSLVDDGVISQDDLDNPTEAVFRVVVEHLGAETADLSDTYDLPYVRYNSEGVPKAFVFHDDGTYTYYSSGSARYSGLYDTLQGTVNMGNVENTLRTWLAPIEFDQATQLLSAVIYYEDDDENEQELYSTIFAEDRQLSLCTTGDADWDDDLDIPTPETAATLSQFDSFVNGCINQLDGRTASFREKDYYGQTVEFLSTYDDSSEGDFFKVELTDVESDDEGWLEATAFIGDVPIGATWNVVEGVLNIMAEDDGYPVSIVVKAVDSNGLKYSTKVFMLNDRYQEQGIEDGKGDVAAYYVEINNPL
ncbi:hypothetical protein [Vibrio sp. WXL210]|uniref:hypothetical protein n=1 Tax=Vibrio sp. WXL210 TaxID=3450709 RepID=UPI003EC73C46